MFLLVLSVLTLGSILPAYANVEVDLLRTAEKRKWDKAASLAKNVKDPLTLKIYDWMSFKWNDKDERHIELSRFIRANSDWPHQVSLRKSFEDMKRADMYHQEVVTWFNDYKPLSAGAAKDYIKALLVAGRKDKVRDYLGEWWANTLIARNDQRKIFKRYGQYISRSAHEKRFNTLLHSRQYTNARAMAGVLGKGYRELAEARIALAERKIGVNALINKVPANLKGDSGLQYERLRWRRKKDLDFRAIEILDQQPAADEVSNPRGWWRERHIIIRRMIEQGRLKTAYMLASQHKQKEGFSYAQAEWLSGWLALQHVKDPLTALEHFQNLYKSVKTPISLGRAAYWAGRSAQDLGRKDLAEKWYAYGAQFQTSFYGQLSAQRLRLNMSLPHQPPPVLSAAQKKAFEQDELIKAVKRLARANLDNEVSAFLKAFTKKYDSGVAFRFAADLASQLDYKFDAIEISKQATKKGFFLTAQAYPTIVNLLKDEEALEWALVHGLIRQESAFDKKAKSPVGALGLMQLMPATARYLAKKHGISHRTTWLTQRPSHNVRLGTLYLQQMLERYDGSYPMAIAAYNAGPSRVDRWIKEYGDPRLGQMDMLDWIETLPIYETRNYIQRVIEATHIYRLRLSGRQKDKLQPVIVSLD